MVKTIGRRAELGREGSRCHCLWPGCGWDRRTEPVKEVGGITIAPTPDTAEWLEMPESAIRTGCIDFVLSNVRAAAEAAYCRHAVEGEPNTCSEFHIDPVPWM